VKTPVSFGEKWTQYHGDCLEVMPTLAPQSVDLIAADLPYQVTACAWDTIIPFEPLWEAFRHVLKPNGAVVLTASQPFTSALVMSNPKWFKYALVWAKTIGSGFINAKNRPISAHEDICIFAPGTIANGSNNRMVYNPQGVINSPYHKRRNKPMTAKSGFLGQRPSHVSSYDVEFINYPTSVLTVANPNHDNFHPTQKPVALFAYLIRTYTNPGDTVLDCTSGSGTTGCAALQELRNFIGIEKDATYYELSVERLRKAARQKVMAL
jgi:site-specific DNA-methyltransferase (adenine-specific)